MRTLARQLREQLPEWAEDLHLEIHEVRGKDWGDESYWQVLIDAHAFDDPDTRIDEKLEIGVDYGAITAHDNDSVERLFRLWEGYDYEIEWYLDRV